MNKAAGEGHEDFLFYYYNRYGRLLRDIALERTRIFEYLTAQFTAGEAAVFLATTRTAPRFPVGFLTLSPASVSNNHRSIWSIKDLFVASAQRGKGIASRLMRKALDYCKVHKVDSVTIVTGRVNTEARSLYEKCGFVNDSIYDDEQNVKYELTVS